MLYEINLHRIKNAIFFFYFKYVQINDKKKVRYIN